MPGVPATRCSRVGLYVGRAGQGPRLLAGHRLPPGRGAGRVHRVPGRRRRELQARDAGAAGAADARPDRRLRLREGLLRARLRPAARARHAPAAEPAARRLHAPDRRRPLHPLPVVLPLRALGRVRDEVRPGPAHAPALRLGPRDRDAVRGAAAPRAGARLPGRAAERYDHKHQELSADDPATRPPPHGARRGEAPAAHARRGRRATCPTASCAACWPPTSARRRTRSPTATRWPPSTGSCFDRHEEEQNVQAFTAALRARSRSSWPTRWARRSCPTGRACGRAMPDAGPRLLAAVQDGRATCRVAGGGCRSARRAPAGRRPTSTAACSTTPATRASPPRPALAALQRATACRSCCAAARRGRRWSALHAALGAGRAARRRERRGHRDPAGGALVARRAPRRRPAAGAARECRCATWPRRCCEIAREAGARLRGFSRLSTARGQRTSPASPEAQAALARGARVRRALPARVRRRAARCARPPSGAGCASPAAAASTT